jgi:hypothetical protein
MLPALKLVNAWSTIAETANFSDDKVVVSCISLAIYCNVICTELICELQADNKETYSLQKIQHK